MRRFSFGGTFFTPPFPLLYSDVPGFLLELLAFCTCASLCTERWAPDKAFFVLMTHTREVQEGKEVVTTVENHKVVFQIPLSRKCPLHKSRTKGTQWTQETPKTVTFMGRVVFWVAGRPNEPRTTRRWVSRGTHGAKGHREAVNPSLGPIVPCFVWDAQVTRKARVGLSHMTGMSSYLNTRFEVQQESKELRATIVGFGCATIKTYGSRESVCV